MYKIFNTLRVEWHGSERKISRATCHVQYSLRASARIKVTKLDITIYIRRCVEFEFNRACTSFSIAFMVWVMSITLDLVETCNLVAFVFLSSVNASSRSSCSFCESIQYSSLCSRTSNGSVSFPWPLPVLQKKALNVKNIYSRKTSELTIFFLLVLRFLPAKCVPETQLCMLWTEYPLMTVQVISNTTDTLVVGGGNGLCHIINLVPCIIKCIFEFTWPLSLLEPQCSLGFLAEGNLRMNAGCLSRPWAPWSMEWLRDHCLQRPNGKASALGF